MAEAGMTARGHTMLNALNKYCRQYFLYTDTPGMDTVKVRMRNDVHRVEEVDQAVIHNRLIRRIADNKIGLLNPQIIPYQPVAGWPQLKLDELVLGAMEEQLDERVWQAVRSHFIKTEVKRVVEKRGGEECLKDMTMVYSYPSSGFNVIKQHLGETDARMFKVRAGCDFQKHFIRTRNERLRREAPEKSNLKQYEDSPNVVMAKERVLRDTTLLLETLMDFMEKLQHLRERHLMSDVPINLNVLGTERDRELTKLHLANRPLQYPGGPPVQHSFKEQVIMQSPEAWPLKPPDKGARSSWRHSSISSKMNVGKKGSLKVFAGSREAMRNSPSPSKKHRSRSSVSEAPQGSPTLSSLLSDPVMANCFRKRWPPVWISLACLDQGSYVVDPLCPSREYTACITQHGSKGPRHNKSLTDIVNMRHSWQATRKAVSKFAVERLWREDKEKLATYYVMFSTLAYLPITKEYPNHERYMYHEKLVARRERQMKEIYDCELTEWYKHLVEKVQEEAGDQDDAINALLSGIKVYFKMSDTSPKYGKAKLALITMSLPAHVVCHVHVQRALAFILVHVLRAPESLLIGWLAVRGLPYVLLESHKI